MQRKKGLCRGIETKRERTFSPPARYFLPRLPNSTTTSLTFSLFFSGLGIFLSGISEREAQICFLNERATCGFKAFFAERYSA